MSCPCNNHSDFYSRNSGCGCNEGRGANDGRCGCNEGRASDDGRYGCNSGYGRSGGYPYDRNDARHRNDCGICRFLRCIFCPCQR